MTTSVASASRAHRERLMCRVADRERALDVPGYKRKELHTMSSADLESYLIELDGRESALASFCVDGARESS